MEWTRECVGWGGGDALLLALLEPALLFEVPSPLALAPASPLPALPSPLREAECEAEAWDDEALEAEPVGAS